MVRGQTSLIVLASLACAARAGAAPAQRVDLTWRSEDPTCIDRATLARTVESTLGRPVFHAEAPASASIEGRVEAATSGSGFRATITMRSPSGEVLSQRDVSTPAASCDRLDEAIAVVVALTVDGVEERVSLRSRLLVLLDGLPDDQRSVFVLYEIEQLSMAEVASALSCPVQTAYSRLHAARERLAKALPKGEVAS
jgi:RNA polymerase sigma factor (sigma-70 family)